MTVDETDEAFANVYSTAVSIQNLAPRAPQRAARRRGRLVATVGALTIDLLSYETFLLLLGSFFVPLFGVLLADWLVAGARYRETRRLRSARGPARDDRRVDRRLRAVPVAAPDWPVAGGSTRRRGEPPDLGIGATLPSFAVSLALGLAVATLGKRRL